MKAIDFAWGANNFQAAQAKAAGIEAVARYYAPLADAKNLTAGEAQNLISAGLQIIGVFEAGESNALGGASQGTIDGTLAGSQAQAAGHPKDVPIFFAVDRNDGADYTAEIEAYLVAASQASGYPVGVYGSWELCRQLVASGTVTKTWVVQTWTAGYNGGLTPSIEQLVEVCPTQWGVNFDNDIVNDASVCWGASQQVITSTESETDMKSYYQEVKGNETVVVPLLDGLRNVSVIAQNDGTSFNAWVLGANHTNRPLVAGSTTAEQTVSYGASLNVVLEPTDVAVSVQNLSPTCLAVVVS